jgi:hypothetical protein
MSWLDYQQQWLLDIFESTDASNVQNAVLRVLPLGGPAYINRMQEIYADFTQILLHTDIKAPMEMDTD